jgi:hypothetical protein
MTIFYCLRFETPPNLEGQVPVFISPRNMARLYSQALGSLFVASYDSQGYGGGIRTASTRDSTTDWLTLLLITSRHEPRRKHISSVECNCWVRVYWDYHMVDTEPLPSNGCCIVCGLCLASGYMPQHIYMIFFWKRIVRRICFCNGFGIVTEQTSRSDFHCSAVDFNETKSVEWR